ncbi:MAG: RNA 2',3'-cyclic phosphodiesterase [Candidatus Korobacteraceae bacterium]
MRLFVALDIDPEIRQRIAEFRDQMRVVAPEVRWVGPETFHVTLQFLGETKKLDEIRAALREVKAASVQLAFRGAGFFPTAKAPRVFWVGIESDQKLQELANAIGAAMRPLGFERDAAPYKPHLTLARAGSGHPRPVPGEHAAPGLQRVRAKVESMAPPEFGTMTAREFCLYESKLSPSGAKYTKVARYPLEPVQDAHL